MKRYIIYKEHHNNGTGLAAIPANETVTSMAEKAQRTLKRLGYPTGLTYKLHTGDIASALRATTKI